MKFSAVVEQASALLQRQGRITYRALRREFDLDEEALADLTAELIDAHRVATDEDGKVLVWTGTSGERNAKSEDREGTVQEAGGAPRKSAMSPTKARPLARRALSCRRPGLSAPASA